MVKVCRCDRCLDQSVSIKLLCKQALTNDIFKTIASYGQYMVYDEREKANMFKTIINRIPVLPCGVLEAKRVVGDKSLKKHLNFETYCYLRSVMFELRRLNINDITDFRRNQSFTNMYDDIYETMRMRYKKPFQITIEELAIMFFSDYFKRFLNDKDEVKLMIKMLNRIFS